MHGAAVSTIGAERAAGAVLRTRHPYAMLLLCCALLWLPGFFTIPPTDRDESRFVQASKQMLETGDFVTIRNGEVARNKKPVGIYWLQVPFAAAARAAGIATENPVWPYRLASFAGALLAVFATFGLGQRLVGREVALLAAGMLAATVILNVEARLAKTDAAQLGAVSVAMLLLGRAYLDRSLTAAGAAVFWLALGAGILIKGPITPMVVGLATLSLVIADRRRPHAARWLGALRAGWGVPLMLAVVVPWFGAIGLATDGAFFQESAGGDLARKVVSGDDGHWGPPLYHLLLLPLLIFPASLFALRALPGAWRDRAEPVTRFLIAWALPSWLVFELVPTKLPHYTLPLYPALCLLAARWALDPARHAGARWWAAVSVIGFVAAGAVIGLGGAALPVVLGGPDWWIGLPSLAAAGIVVFLVLASVRREDWPGGSLAAVAAMPLLCIALLGLAIPSTRALWITPRLCDAVTRAGVPPERFGAVGYHEPSMLFLCGTETRLLPTGWDGARWLAAEPGRLIAVGERDMAAFREENARLRTTPRDVATVRGMNYSRGRPTELTLFVR